MAGRDRERRLAREHHERQQGARDQASARARKRNSVIAGVVSGAVVIGGVAAIALTNGDNKTTATPQTSPSPTTSAAEPTPTTSTTTSANACPAGTATPVTTPKSYKAPPVPVKGATSYTATLATSCGPITVQLLAGQAPKTVASFRFLANAHFFDHTPCHRLVTTGIYVLQCGDPTGQGTGGPGYTIPLENAPKSGHYPAGTVAMARAQDPNSGGSQFFLVYKDTELPDPTGYAVFGKVVSGMNVLQRIAAGGVADASGDGPPKIPVSLESVTVGK